MGWPLNDSSSGGGGGSRTEQVHCAVDRTHILVLVTLLHYRQLFEMNEKQTFANLNRSGVDGDGDDDEGHVREK